MIHDWKRFSLFMNVFFYVVLVLSTLIVVRGDILPPGVLVPFPPFYRSFLCFSDITSGSVHLDVCWIDQSTRLPTWDVTKTQEKADFLTACNG